MSLRLCPIVWICWMAIVPRCALAQAEAPRLELTIEQITFGDKHHFFGYIGQCQTVPWSADGRYILCLEIEQIDRMPKPDEAAAVLLVDTQAENRLIRLDASRAWNPQQGTMFYWHPKAASTQFFFNDRDVATGKVFAVLYDIEKRKRVREYRFEETPIGNSGVSPTGDAFLGLNYGRLARLRLVTGYPGALDWSKADNAPENDGLFLVDIPTGKQQLLVSYDQLAQRLKERQPNVEATALFINHTLWNRRGDRIYFFVRGGWGQRGDRINMPCSVRADGSGLTLHDTHIGGHPDWAEGTLLIGRQDDRQILYDVDKKSVVAALGSLELFPDPEGDISLSPNGDMFVNGYKQGNKNLYAVYRRSDGAFGRSAGLDRGTFAGDIRIDPAPCWNRASDAILAPGVADKTRQMFVIRVKADRGPTPERSTNDSETN